MHDPAYKQLFSRPRMVRDLLDGFAARGWSDALDFDTLTLLPASLVSRDLQQRHGDLVWRIRFRGERWLHLVVLLEFQSTVDRAMALRMWTYTGLIYERLAADGALREHKVLPTVLPIVIYNGGPPWTAPVEAAELLAPRREALAPYQRSPRYYLLDAGRAADADLPAGNLVSALVRLEKAREATSLRGALRGLVGLLASQADGELTRVFVTWLYRGLRLADRLPAGEGDPLALLREADTMLEETVQGWKREWFEQGRAEGVAQGRAEGVAQGRAEGVEQGRAEGVEQGVVRERALLCRQAARKFDGATAEGLAAALAEVADPDRLGRVGDWIIECATASDLLARVRGDGRSGN